MLADDSESLPAEKENPLIFQLRIIQRQQDLEVDKEIVPIRYFLASHQAELEVGLQACLQWPEFPVSVVSEIILI